MLVNEKNPVGIEKLREVRHNPETPISVEQMQALLRSLAPKLRLVALNATQIKRFRATGTIDGGYVVVLAPGKDGNLTYHKVVPTTIGDRTDGTAPLRVSDVCDATGLSPDDLYDLIVDFGTWVGKANRRPAPTAPAARDDDGQFQAVVFDPEAATVVYRSTEEAFEVLGQFAPPAGGVLPDGRRYVIWEGLTKEQIGRDLSKSIDNIASTNPTEAQVRRYLIRRFNDVVATPVWGVVQAVHRFAAQGMLDVIDEAIQLRKAGPPSTKLAELIVVSYDMLDISRQDAIRAVDQLVAAARTFPQAGEVTPGDVEALRAHATRARFLGEADMDRIVRFVDMYSGDPWALIRELRHFARKVEANPNQWHPAHIGLLNEGQVKRIAASYGVVCERLSPDENRMLRATIRDAGLNHDMDDLLAVGERALGLGGLDVFRDAVARRGEGDVHWDDELNEFFTAATISRGLRRPQPV